MGMAGSLLPSHDARVLAPKEIHGEVFVIEPFESLQTYVLKANGSVIASHPNGYSLKELADRIAACATCKEQKTRGVAYDRAVAQWDYILACGGLTRSKTVLEYYLEKR